MTTILCLDNSKLKTKCDLNFDKYDNIITLKADITNINLSDYKDVAWIILSFEPSAETLNQLLSETNSNIIVNIINTTFSSYCLQLPQIIGNKRLIGMCIWPSLWQRSLLELSLPPLAPLETADALSALLAKPYRQVADSVGLVTPRMLAMLVNEACFTVGEGTATYQAIDPAMQLGVNYPKGPFTWANEIGVSEIGRLMLAIHHRTGEERYKIAPLLLKHMELNQNFPI